MISIITCTFGNRRKLLERSVNSVFKQTYKDWELIISDDASTDDTESYVTSLKDKRVKYHKRKTNWGNQTKPINDVLPMCKGDYIAFLDSDNEYLPDHLQILYKRITDDSKLDLVYGDRFFIDETGAIPTQIGIFHDFAPQLLLQKNYIDMSDFLVKKECVYYVGGMDERYKRFADWNLLVRLCKAGFKFERVPLVITKYYYHSDSLSAKLVENKDNPTQPLWNAYELEVRLPYLTKIQEPKVAVYSLTMNRLEYTKKCFTECKQTAGYNYDHFVIDQNSTDGTKEWLREYKPFVLVENKENEGISKASNLAVNLIKESGNYDIIIKIDNDAMPLTMGWLKEFVELYKKNHMMCWAPYPEGLKDNPGGAPRQAYGNLNGHLVGMTGHLGGMVHIAPSEAYKDWKWDETDPKHGMQDLLFSQYLSKQGYGMAYVEDIRFSHGPEGTEAQHKDYPEYFERRKEEKGDPNSKEHWDDVYSKEEDGDPHYRNDKFSFDILSKELMNKKILDAGCGNGYFLKYLKDNGFTRLYGFDLSKSGIEKARKRTGIKVLNVASIYNIPFQENGFNYVVTSEVLEHLQDIKKAVGEVYRVLKKGGYSVNLLPYKNTIPNDEHVAEYDEESIKEVFKDFSEVETRVYTHPAFAKFIDGKNVGNRKLLFVKAKKGVGAS